MGSRIKQVIIRVSPSEHSEMLARAGKMRLAPWLRAAALDAIPPTIPQINRDALAELHRVGANLNQIARKLNSSGEVDLHDLRSTVSELRATLAGAQK